jgi:arylsulfatase A-like enzyme
MKTLLRFVVLAFHAASVAAAPLAQPNILFVLADDVSAKEYAIYGGEGIRTPVLDRLAREGTFFRTAWGAPVCGPSRAMLMTGRYAERSGFAGQLGSASELGERNRLLLPRMLRAAGYRTIMAGKLHHEGLPSNLGFEHYLVCRPWPGYTGAPQNPDMGVMYQAQWYWHPGHVRDGEGVPTGPDDFGPEREADYLREEIGSADHRPFYIEWNTYLPHHEYCIVPGQYPWRRPEVPELDGSGRRTGRRLPGTLKSNLEYLDAQLGRLVEALIRSGRINNTLIVFAGDNGTAGWGKGHADGERAPHVPFVVYGPMLRRNGGRDELIDFTDLLPTFAELAGGAIPADYSIDGRSFAPLLRGERFVPRVWIHTRLDDRTWYRTATWIRDGNGAFWLTGGHRAEWAGGYVFMPTDDPQSRHLEGEYNAIQSSRRAIR